MIDGGDKVLSDFIEWRYKTFVFLDNDDTVLCHSMEVTQYCAILPITPTLHRSMADNLHNVELNVCNGCETFQEIHLKRGRNNWWRLEKEKILTA
jgi:5'(3')-deoxyribonucleotidase